LAVSAISCWEIATLWRLGRIELDRDVATWVGRAVAEEPPVSVIGVSREIAVSAGELGSAFPGDPADRIIFATAAAQRCALVTKDRRLRSYSAALTVW
jgi:PIN domain nuclease of toxin-antitoxin system